MVSRRLKIKVVFAGDDDYLYYLDMLQEWKSQLGCKI
jgi:hypothetical protein